MSKELKKEYTEKLRQAFLNNGRIQDFDVDQIKDMNIWKSPGDGLRLLGFGYTLFLALGIQQWDFPIEDRLELTSKNKFLINIDRHIDCPYFIHLKLKPHVSIFGAKLATAIAIKGSFIKFINVRAKRFKDNSAN